MDETTEESKEMTDDEKEGVKAIQFLLSMANRTEAKDISLRNWRNMDDVDRQTTLAMYHYFLSGGQP